WLEADIGCWNSMLEAIGTLESFGAVVHAAADIRPAADAAALTRTNALGTAHVLEAARRWGARHFTYISSLSCIGRPVQFPIGEEHPPGPLTAYGHAKYCGEGLSLLADSDTLRTCALRI